MKRTAYLIALSAFIFHVDQFCMAQVMKPYAESITADELKEHLQILASDAFEGRETGKPGQKKAAQYIADYYAALGVNPVNNGSWFQQYPLKKESFTASYATAGSKRYGFIKDFYFFGSEQTELKAAELVFAGYGIDAKKYNDYKRIDVKDKIVVCLMGEPINKKGNKILTGSLESSEWGDDWELKARAASERGAKGILFINMQYDAYMKRVSYWLEQAPMRLDRPEAPEADYVKIPMIFVSPAMANDLLMATGKTAEALEQRIVKKGKTCSVSTGTDLVFHMEPNTEKLTAENVLCYIEGTDPLLKEELVVISAHYDHIGIVNGQINNGADDDGSGTVTTLELAEAFTAAKKEGFGTKRSILILNVSGEEKGLLGSEWYSDNPVFPLSQTVCNLNIDMIGRKDDAHDNANYVYLIGSDKLSTDLHKISESCNSSYTQLKLDYTYNDPKDPNRFYYRSDHYNFAKHGIPVIFYFSGVHADYHKPGDDTEKIMFDKMSVIAKLVFYTACEVANREERLKVDVKSDFENR
jgi:hypothetical protein